MYGPRQDLVDSLASMIEQYLPISVHSDDNGSERIAQSIVDAIISIRDEALDDERTAIMTRRGNNFGRKSRKN